MRLVIGALDRCNISTFYEKERSQFRMFFRDVIIEKPACFLYVKIEDK
jgi:hypothetical protein